MGVLFMGYIAYDINMIKKMSSFISVEDTAGFKMSLMFGFKLLIDFVGLL
ncbi:hypothetical protein FACS189459_5070 [Bacilli bacterium]|nr:hypothetical protein FACS189459_5070 [Bacilli bacterium]